MADEPLIVQGVIIENFWPCRWCGKVFILHKSNWKWECPESKMTFSNAVSWYRPMDNFQWIEWKKGKQYNLPAL